jgi:hypothetical protein
MKKFTFFLIALLLFIVNADGQERQKLAQTGLKFLSVSTDARMSGLGDAVTSFSDASASAMFYNPSTMAGMRDMVSLTANWFKWIAEIKYFSAAAAFRPFDGNFGVLGFSMTSVDYGDFKRTIFAANEDGYLDLGTYRPTAIAFGVGYAKELSEKFAVGGNVKYVRQSLGVSIVDIDLGGNTREETNMVDALAFDFGILYHTGFRSLDFGMSIRNFSTELRYKQQGFQLPLTFKIGLSFNTMDLLDVDRDMHSFIVAVDASHPRDYSEQINIGGEYVFMNTFSLRAGYTFPTDEQEFTVGVGLKQRLIGNLLGVDYSYTPFGIFSDIHRFSVNFAFQSR